MSETQQVLKLNDVFWTVQGEGHNWGRRALFVRMPFCNLACTWCDTEYNSYKTWSVSEFTEFAKQESCRFAVITGGEPMMNKHTPMIIAILKNLGFEIACESNGTFPILSGIDFATVSPKRDADFDIHEENYWKANELKLVVDKDFDFEICKKFESMSCRLSLSPEFNEWQENVERILNFIKENPKWRISLQTHKILNVK
jgi:organic radical activating enzyme